MAFESQIPAKHIDQWFFYESIMSAHPKNAIPETDFWGKRLLLPLWVSDMTSGTRLDATINGDLTWVRNVFGLGIGQRVVPGSWTSFE